MSHLPHIRNLKSINENEDFDAIKFYVHNFRKIEAKYNSLPNHLKHSIHLDSKYTKAIEQDVQLRRFIAMAYSVLQLDIDKYDIADWKWTSWLAANLPKLSVAVSLNYDLNLENALTNSGAICYRVGTNELQKGVPVIKPHGSIDFDLPDSVININPWSLSASLNDAQYVQVIPKSKWLSPRMEADIIVPSLHNIQLHLSWVEKMYAQYAESAKEIDTLVIIGCSYWDVDRPEIDLFLNKLKKRTKIFVIDPSPSIDLKKKIQALGLSYREGNTNGLPW